MLKYFNENISLALQERYRDLNEYRKAEAVDGSPREAKIPKIAEEGDQVGGDGSFEGAAPPYPRLLEPPKEEDNFVASWLQNSFKMTPVESNDPAAGGSALDLRAAPLSLHIPALQAAEAQRQFKMQDFWNRSRPGSPQDMGEGHSQPGPAPPTPQPSATPDHKIITEKLVSEIQQQQQSPSADSTMSERSLVPFALVNLLSSLNNVDAQQQSPTTDAPIGDRNSMLPFALQQARSGQSISERTLEECWSTLQRIFMHKNAMQMHARELQRGLGGEVKPHQCQQCLKSFSSNHQLVQHIRVHTGEKPYKCSYCDRRFKQLSHVQQHTRLHTGERPYKCHLPDCGRAFIQLSNLQQHLRNHDAQVERAKNRPFHCNICGKGFATESSLRTHTAKELQLHLGVLQQHAALMIGGASATPCPICHKVVFGGEALVEHMKNTHKDPNASGVASPPATSPYPAQAKPTDPYIAKRRTANHPCPVCGKHYVNEGSLRKHLACHPETQLTSGLRMWPCSVCQAVFTHESGLLSHMEHMRMEPKHQFAAQYVLSRAAAERRERDLLAAVSASAGGSGLLNLAPPSPTHSDSSSNGRLSSSAGSEAGAAVNKLSDLLRSANGHQSYGDERVAAIAAAAANMMAQPGEGANAVQVAAANLVTAMRQQLAREPPPVQPPPEPPSNTEAALRVQQAEALLRSQAEALRLAVSQAAHAHNAEAPSPLRHNGGYPPQTPNDVSGQLSPELVEAFRIAQEQRLEQALRLHDPRMLGFNLPSPVQQAAQQAAQQAVAAQQVAAAQQAAQQVAQQAAQAAQQAAQQAVQQQHLHHQATQAAQAAQQAAQQAVHLQQNPQP